MCKSKITKCCLRGRYCYEIQLLREAYTETRQTFKMVPFPKINNDWKLTGRNICSLVGSGKCSSGRIVFWKYLHILLNTAQKMKFSIKDLVIFTEDILNGKLHFLCSVKAIQFLNCNPYSTLQKRIGFMEYN